ncbi:hypothetical protein DV737_g3314, partial [Chaetothyriales sp. CBS 132003]
MASSLHVVVELDNVNALDDHASNNHPHRSITLSAPYWRAMIGRSTNSTGGQHESDTNARFNSRVVSRDHAKLRADPDTRIVTIEDVGSLHGTRVDGHRLSPGEPEPLYGGAIITLGTEVERIEHTSTITFNPVTVQVFYSWSDEEYEPPAPVATPAPAHSRNAFTADYSDDGAATPYMSEDDDDLYFPDPLQRLPRTFTVPSSSDLSDDHISILSDDAHAEPDSPSSSPVGSPDLADSSNVEARKRDGPEPANAALPGDSVREAIQIDSDLDNCFHQSSRFKARQGCEEHEKPSAATDRPEEPQPKLLPHARPSADSSSPGPEGGSRLSASATKPEDSSRPSVSTAKPTATRSPPFLQNILNSNNSESEDAIPRRPGCLWAGHNAVLYDPVPVSPDLAGPSVLSKVLSDLHPPTPANCQTGPIGTAFNDMNGEGRQPLSDSHVEAKASETPISSAAADTFTLAHSRVQAKASETPISSAAADTFTLAPTELGCEIKPSRKRKLEDVAFDASFADARGQASAEAQTKDSMSVVEDTTTALASVESVLPSADAALERPAKQQKTSHQAQPINRASPFATFAAGALAGVAIGTISTFLGLAALPADYFV